jgi:hypothetical protein
MSDPRTLLQTPDEFRAWLTALCAENPQAWVGYTISCPHCPIATFLSRRGVQVPQIGSRSVSWQPRYGGVQNATLPKWARSYAEVIDEAADGRELFVTAETALRYLDSLEGRQCAS